MTQLTLQQAFAAAFAHEAAGRAAAARAIYAQILADIPDHPGALLRIAEHELQDGQPRSARQHLEAAVAGAQAHSLPAQDIWHALARACAALGDLEAARDAAGRARELAPETLPPLQLLAWLALEAGEPDVAQDWCQLGLAHSPRDPILLHLLGRALKACGAIQAAYRALSDCVSVAGDDPAVLTTLGGVCIEAGELQEARRRLERAVAAGAQDAHVWDNLGLAYRLLGDFERAEQAFERAVAVDPALVPALANLVQVRRYLCAWDGIEDLERRLEAALDAPNSDPRWSPHAALASALSPEQQLAVARRWSRATLPAVVAPPRTPPRRNRLRIGYLSGDLREHPVGRLMAGLFEMHDRDRVDVFAYSYGRPDGSALHDRIRAAFESRWRDVNDAPDGAIAQMIRDDGIDVLIECAGHIRGGRLAILASRPAPVQLHYLGYPGTLGYDAIDGLVTDSEVVPEGDEKFFQERIWRMPRCYLVNDRSRALPPPASRTAAGLPDDALVLACFNQSYKLTAPVFATWMQALRRAPDAVLWLLAPSARAQANLRTRAADAGIASSRLLFAPLVSPQEHIARLRCADLALDTSPVGSHTTGCDALWAGVPLLTCRGRTFASRVGASILHTAGLTQLVTTSLDSYEARLVELVSERGALREYKLLLDRTHRDNPLFDTEGFTRDWEALLARAYEETLASR